MTTVPHAACARETTDRKIGSCLKPFASGHTALPEGRDTTRVQPLRLFPSFSFLSTESLATVSADAHCISGLTFIVHAPYAPAILSGPGNCRTHRSYLPPLSFSTFSSPSSAPVGHTFYFEVPMALSYDFARIGARVASVDRSRLLARHTGWAAMSSTSCSYPTLVFDIEWRHRDAAGFTNLLNTFTPRPLLTSRSIIRMRQLRPTMLQQHIPKWASFTSSYRMKTSFLS
jgi:hypothetical protein